MNTLKSALCIALASLAVAACGERPPEKKAATQVAAKVNGGEISIHQINFVLQRTPGIGPDQAETAKRQVLESLIEQELAVQQALDAKLERSPGVMEAIEAARRDILARAYLEQAVGKNKPAADEIRKFYTEHPELFSNRKIYRLEEIAFNATPEIIANVKDLIGKGRAVAEVVATLKASGIEARGGISVKPAEQMALEALPAIAQAREGQSIVFENAGRAAIVTLLAAKADPLDEAKAQPFIENYLANKQRADQARDAVKQLREKAKIEYVGEFSASKPAAAPEKAAAAPKDAAINKGIAGLK